ncbi:cytidine deaminase (CDA) [Vairimorpha necatrix]|uniref:Cytidine deaminase n=1 Tax=Vairimorpha necatrix TaxID=6039 RepID=A0AAX4JF25_9MICR
MKLSVNIDKFEKLDIKNNEEDILDIKNNEQDILALIYAANEVRKNAYCPYSKFAVGAAIKTSTGEIFTGCNIENSCFSPSICAERSAIAKAVSAGHREIVECAVVAYLPDAYVYPCGVCRQTLAEFTDYKKDCLIFLAKPDSLDGEYLATSVSEILPGIGKLKLSN